jgi:hypothetical protein
MNRQKLALTSLTSGFRSVGIVRSRTEATDFLIFSSHAFSVAVRVAMSHTGNRLRTTAVTGCPCEIRAHRDTGKLFLQSIGNLSSWGWKWKLTSCRILKMRLEESSTRLQRWVWIRDKNFVAREKLKLSAQWSYKARGSEACFGSALKKLRN